MGHGRADVPPGTGQGTRDAAVSPKAPATPKWCQRDLPPALVNTGSDKAQQMLKRELWKILYTVNSLLKHRSFFWGEGGRI